MDGGTWSELQRRGADVLKDAAYSPSRMTEFAETWKGVVAQIIGGCCGSGPEHISAMQAIVKGG